MSLPVKGGRKPPPMPRNSDTDDEEDLSDLEVRPPPPPASGSFRARVARLQVFNQADGKKVRAIIFAINDPKEQEKLNRNEPSQQGKEIIFRLQFDGNFYQQTMRALGALGFAYDTWPEGQGNARVLPWAKMKEVLTPAEIAKAPHFTITIKATEGKGDRVGDVFENITKIEAAKAEKPKKNKPKPDTEEPKPDTEEPDSINHGDALPGGSDGAKHDNGMQNAGADEDVF